MSVDDDADRHQRPRRALSAAAAAPDRSVQVERHPDGVVAVHGGDGWRAANGFSIRWTDPPQSPSPITAAVYQFCPGGAVDSSKHVAGSDARRPGNELATKVKVPAPGDWKLRLWLRDSAGNDSSANATTVDHVRFDPTPPTAAIAPPDPNDPTRIHVLATDDVSGVAGGEVEAQLSGESIWRPLPTQVVAGGLAATLDVSQLPDGPSGVRHGAYS